MASELFDTYDLKVGSPPKPSNGHKKTWRELQNTVRETRKAIARLTPSVPCNFQFRTITDEFGNTITRLYFLGALEMGKDSTLLQADIPDTPLSQPMGGGDASSSQADSAGGDAWSQSLPALWASALFSSQPSGTAAPMSREEQLLRERKRLCSYGLTSYELSREDGLFVIPASNSLYVCHDSGDGAPVPTEVPTMTYGARLDPKLCPSNTDLLAFVHEADLWLTCLGTGKEIRLTYARNSFPSRLEEEYLSAGVPSFVIQEEFDRYTGYWWSPVCQRPSDGKRVYHILYEEVDESDVDIVSLFAPTEHDTSTDQYRYPKAGTANALSNLKLLEISLFFSGPTTQVTDIQVTERSLKPGLFQMCPWGEYLVRAGWTADGNYVYAVVMDRLQMRQAVLLISPYSFRSEAADGPAPHIQCIFEETTDVWINVHNCIHFLPQTSESEISFIFASEKSGFCHLYLITSKLRPQGVGFLHSGQGDGPESYPSQAVKEVVLTSGQWVVLPEQVLVDEARQMVYFMALKDTPLEHHLYAVSYSQPTPMTPIRLTSPGSSHSVHISEDFSKFVTVFSSLQSPPQSCVYSIQHTGPADLSFQPIGQLTPKTATLGYTPPSLFQYPSRAGHVTYGLYFLPRGYEQGRRYPTVLFVYGGPQVQMVSNSFKGQKLLRLHTLAAEGYAVVVIDGRGSSNRGLAFESVLKNQLGTVEINDQVEGLLWLASQTDFIDMSRVAIHGWSYGGYLSLLGLAQRGDVFKVAIAGAPVVNWEFYDTGYTERYLGLPQSNSNVYRSGSVLSYIHKLPEGENKLLLIHGLIDENVHFLHSSSLIQQLITHCKPYQLQVYPNERHGIRNHEASEHYKTTMLQFLQEHL
ncbi:dipeptidyl peptidase 9 [Aplysia californica]|uniref:Dipeptidyl peptidase 9 n=1 Tax=Aplysia californica TaxID=6500 RepID=A0ABM1A5Q0_APLCA|nr:dipeptidyl peptidase 9 [Aplysia californica]